MPIVLWAAVAAAATVTAIAVDHLSTQILEEDHFDVFGDEHVGK